MDHFPADVVWIENNTERACTTHLQQLNTYIHIQKQRTSFGKSLLDFCSQMDSGLRFSNISICRLSPFFVRLFQKETDLRRCWNALLLDPKFDMPNPMHQKGVLFPSAALTGLIGRLTTRVDKSIAHTGLRDIPDSLSGYNSRFSLWIQFQILSLDTTPDSLSGYNSTFSLWMQFQILSGYNSGKAQSGWPSYESPRLNRTWHIWFSSGFWRMSLLFRQWGHWFRSVFVCCF